MGIVAEPSGCIWTYDGKRFNLLDRKEKKHEIRIEDIAHSLSLKPRFNGHTGMLWTEAQHSLLVTKLISSYFRNRFDNVRDMHIAMVFGLINNASDAYVTDIATPLKELNGTYLKIKDLIQLEIISALNLAELITKESCELIFSVINEAEELALAVEVVELLYPTFELEDYFSFYQNLVDSYRYLIKRSSPLFVKGEIIRVLSFICNILGVDMTWMPNMIKRSSLDWHCYLLKYSYTPILSSFDNRLYYMKYADNKYSIVTSDKEISISNSVVENSLDLIEDIDEVIENEKA